MTRTSSTSPWPATLLLVGAGVVSAVQVGKAPAALQAVQTALAIPLTQAAWLLSAFGVVGAVFGVAIGLAADRFGARRALVAGLLLQGIASATGALAQHPALLIASRIVEGIGFLGAIVSAPALMAHITRGRDAAGPFAAWSTFMPAGMALILLASPWLLSSGWRALWWAGSAAALVLAGAVAWRAPHAPAPGGTGGTAPLRQTLLARGPICLLLLFMLYSGAWFALFGLLPVVLEDGLAPTPARANALTALAIGAGAAGNLVGGMLAARGARPSSLLAWAFGASAVLALGVAAAPLSPGWRLGLLVAFAVVSGIVPPALFAAAPAQAPHPSAVGVTLGMMMQGNNLGLVAGPAVGAFLTGAGGWPALGAGVAAAACTAIAVARWLLPRTTDSETSPILLRNTMAFDRQHAAEFKRAIVNAVQFANRHAPQLMVQTYIDEANGLCYSFQLFQDSDAVLRHWQVSDPGIAEVMKYCVIRSMEVYGEPSQAVRDGILDAVDGARVSFTPALAGFCRIG